MRQGGYTCPRSEKGSELNPGGLPPPRPSGVVGCRPPPPPQMRGVWGGSPPTRRVWGAGAPQDSASIPFQTWGTCSHPVRGSCTPHASSRKSTLRAWAEKRASRNGTNKLRTSQNKKTPVEHVLTRTQTAKPVKNRTNTNTKRRNTNEHNTKHLGGPYPTKVLTRPGWVLSQWRYFRLLKQYSA